MNSNERVNLTPAQQVDQHAKVETQQVQRQNVHQQKRNQVQYQLKQVIGKGSYGIVYKAINKKTQQLVAIKEINYENDDELTDILSEIDLLKNLNHINIVKYHGFIQKSHNLYIILEYCSHGSLKNLISRGNGLAESKARSFVKQTLNGLNYLHEQGVIHRDIKAANLLLDSNNIVKLADFGVSTKVNTMAMAMTLAGSLNWMAPEIIGNRGASTLSDIWSLGATVLELLTGNPPFHNLVDINIYYAIENDSFIPPNFLSIEAQDFLLTCFQKNMYKRPTAVQLLKHKWLSLSDTNKLEVFKENINEVDYRWDEDFKEPVIDNSNIGGSILKTVSPLLSSLDTLNNLGVKTQTHIEESTLAMLFTQISQQDLIMKMIELSKTKKNQEILISLFEYDRNINDSKLKESFIKMGGIPYIFSQDRIIEQFFVKDSVRALIQCGIMSQENLKTINETLSLELIFKFLEITNSIPFWYKWCSHNLNTSTLFGNLQNKFAQSIILKLSSFDDNSNWFTQQFINHLLNSTSNEKLDQQTLSIIFKALSSILIQSNSTSLSSRSSSSSSCSPFSTSESLVNAPPPDRILRSSILPNNFVPWVLGFLDDPSFYNMKNLHFWKYYIIVIYHSTHLKKPSLLCLIKSNKFLELVLRLLFKNTDDPLASHEFQLSIMHLSLSIVIEISNEIRTFNPLLLKLSLIYINFDDESITGGLEILLNCLQLALHDNSKFIKNLEDLSISFPSSSTYTSFNTSLNYQDLVDPFFKIREDNVQFGKFITKFIKICSLAPLDFVSVKILVHPKCIERLILFFKLYRNSLLIQIDLLKFIKVLFTRALEFIELNRTAISRKEIHRFIFSKLQEMAAFLNGNWNHQQPGQVGSDSILIHQLCHDIKSLSLQGPAPTQSIANLEKDEFVIPKVPSA